MAYYRLEALPKSKLKLKRTESRQKIFYYYLELISDQH